MSAPGTSKRDAINAAMSVADDVAQNKLDPSSLDAALADELRELFGDVVGQNDSLWPLQLDVARRVIALGGISPDELSEWAAALRHRERQQHAEPSDERDAGNASTEQVSTGSDALGPQDDALHAIADADAASSADVETEAQPDDAAASSTEDGCGCSSPTMVTLLDGRRVPSHLIAARGRDLPTVY